MMEGKIRGNDASSSSGSSSNSRGETVVVDCGRRRSSCGYCRSGSRSSISHGLWAHSITVDDYQGLLDRGWRRSGCFLYKPDMEKTCCPSYTIRLRACEFVPSKEQQRVLRKMQRFLDGMLDVNKAMEVVEDPNISNDFCSCASVEVSSAGTKETFPPKNERKNRAENIANNLSDQVDLAVLTCAENGEFPCNIQLPKASVKQVSQAKRKLLVEGAEDLLYSSNIAFQIAAAIRRSERGKDAQHTAKDDTLSPRVIAEKLTSYLKQLSETSGLLIRACNGHINFYESKTQASSGDGAHIVTALKESGALCTKKVCCTRKSAKHPQGKRRKLDIHLKKSSFDLEEFALYRKYQMKVHNEAPDHVTESSYRRFLVDTPLVFVPPSGDGEAPPCGFGSFHQQYVVDGRLVAVGVIDILPKCLSSKYLFWDPDFAFLSLGKYSALQEIGWVKKNQVYCPSLQYYYLGYYIHSCSKMRYKAAYSPSELLCPLRYQWVPFTMARPLLDRNPYVVLSDYALFENAESSTLHASENVTEMQRDDNGNEDSNDVLMEDGEEMDGPDSESADDEFGPETSTQTLEDSDVGNILIGLKVSRVRYKDLQRAFGPSERRYLESQLRRYKSVVGVELSETIVYSLN